MSDLLTYIAFKALSLAATLAGPRGRVAMGRLMGMFIGATDHRTGKLLRHLSLAVGPRRAKAVLPRYYEHLGLLAVEYLAVALYTPATVDEWMLPAGVDLFREALGRGKGMLVLAGHVGNWELCGQALVSNGLSVNVLYKPLKNAYLDRELRRIRERHGMSVHAKQEGAKFVLRAIKAGEASGVLVDQNGGRDGVWVPFFGKLALTLPTAARFARRTGAAIMPVTGFRLDDRVRHSLRIGPEVVPVRTSDEERDILITTWLCNRAIERAILDRPAQWIWAHRRWRGEPPPEAVEAWRKAEDWMRANAPSLMA